VVVDSGSGVLAGVLAGGAEEGAAAEGVLEACGVSDGLSAGGLEEGAGAEASVLGCGAAEGVTDGEAGPEGAVEAGGAEEGADSSSEGAGEEAGSEAGAEEGATSELDATIEGDNVLAAGLLDMLTTTIAQPKRPCTQSKERLGRGSEQGTEN